MKLNYFNFKQFNDYVLLTNDFGDYCFISPDDFKSLIAKKIDIDSEVGKKLRENRMIYEANDLGFSCNNKYNLREIKKYVHIATSLHIFVVTTACNMNCVYCQANNGTACSDLYMDEEIAKKAVDIALQSPSRKLTFEFQGGEPLLNFKIIKYIVEYAEVNKKDKSIEYNIVTNLTLLTDEVLDFFEQYKLNISTSLDGIENVHNTNRHFANNENSYKIVLSAIEKIKTRNMYVGAIETTTRYTLDHPKDLVRTYTKLGFDSIFIRALTPLGKAAKNWEKIGYTAEEFIAFYKKAVDELIQINKEGKYIREAHATIFLEKIRGNCVNYMELRSPCGAGIGQIAYYADGSIFTCDEGRMLYEMGEKAFYLGNVYENTYSELIGSRVCKAVCAASILETIPSCCDCVYQPYCGVCPVVSFAMCKDVIEKQPRGYKCNVYSGILDYLFHFFYENDEETVRILNSWSN